LLCRAAAVVDDVVYALARLNFQVNSPVPHYQSSWGHSEPSQVSFSYPPLYLSHFLDQLLPLDQKFEQEGHQCQQDGERHMVHFF
jgi:hypothetical protein